MPRVVEQEARGKVPRLATGFPHRPPEAALTGPDSAVTARTVTAGVAMRSVMRR
ncbi:hypothetical protein [Microbispora bryophytorum]|uniref:Uncharacterized protein n=1 Tax=Microbispora bryophytorum TaxID=1460882 RepID=A0A8H9H3C1_9ACTN|nr:hypothetical protein [Microbispora bryophytorum]MBD3134994.1 hypothetical protein [Microbispora bryophytorum]GGO11227.1 hypothetical protein GCM10011574_28520 [Microbispora bryophytorum]